MNIHQFVAGFSRGDAISNEALALRDMFRSWGYASEIFSEARRILPELRQEAGDLLTYLPESRPDDVVLLHLSIGSQVNEVFVGLPCKKALLYHNITPPEFFQGVQQETAVHLAKGREQLRGLAGVVDVVMADSAFNARELESLGYDEVKVFPLVLNLDVLRDKPSRKIMKKYNDGLVNILFVGRFVPNKRMEDCLSAFYYFQNYVHPETRFIHVGSWAGTEQYHALLLIYVRDLQLNDVEFIGSVPQDELNAVYQSADLFLCMSEHEGFCIPLIESIVHGVPVLAYDAAAVSETLDGAGILLRDKQFDLVAEMMGELTRDRPLRRTVLEQQRKRLSRYENRNLEEELRRHLGILIHT